MRTWDWDWIGGSLSFLSDALPLSSPSTFPPPSTLTAPGEECFADTSGWSLVLSIGVRRLSRIEVSSQTIVNYDHLAYV